MKREDYFRIMNQYNVDADADCICSYWPMWGRGGYGILYKTKDGKFISEEGISDDGLEEEILECKEVDVDFAKEYVKEYLEMSAGLDAVDDLDELIKIWKDIFGEDITEW